MKWEIKKTVVVLSLIDAVIMLFYLLFLYVIPVLLNISNQYPLSYAMDFILLILMVTFIPLLICLIIIIGEE